MEQLNEQKIDYKQVSKEKIQMTAMQQVHRAASSDCKQVEVNWKNSFKKNIWTDVLPDLIDFVESSTESYLAVKEELAITNRCEGT